MIVRIWTTGIITGKEDEYLKFAERYSLPMFKKQTGIQGVSILIKDNKSLVLTYWKHQKDIIEMENNELYKETVKKIMSNNFLSGPQNVEIFDLPIVYNSNINSLENI